MKKLLILLPLIAIALGGSVFAQKERKLPAKSYVTTAKIEILEGAKDPARTKYAMVMLDSLFLNYGPHAEGLFWMTQIYVDFYEKGTNHEQKLDAAKKIVAYSDSLKLCCANESVKADFKKDCSSLIAKTDSAKALFWRQVYNDGVEKANSVGEIYNSINTATDSSFKADEEKRLQATITESKNSFDLALMFDPKDDRPWIGLANIAEQTNDFPGASEYLTHAVEVAKDRNPLLQRLGYNLAQQGKYCDAIPYLRDYVNANKSDFETAGNLAICYNNCKMYDSATAVFRQMLSGDSKNTDALRGISRYYVQLATQAGDSAKEQGEKNESAQKKWMDQRNVYFDSARAYAKLHSEAAPTDTSAAQFYGLYSAIVGKYDEAIVGYTNATTLYPSDTNSWSRLGDCYFDTRKFDKAAAAYEKAAQLDPSNKDVLNRLADLYGELKQPAKRDAILKKLGSN